MTIETILKNLKYRRMDIRFYVERQVRMRHWIGAALRNNFLCAAEEVRNAQGVSLRQRLDTLPLPKEHFLYKQFCGGFPKSFFFDASALPYEAPGFVFQPNREYKVSLIQIGSRFHEEEAFLEAIRRMFSKGFGHPVTPLTLLHYYWSNYIGLILRSVLEADQRKNLKKKCEKLLISSGVIYLGLLQLFGK